MKFILEKHFFFNVILMNAHFYKKFCTEETEEIAIFQAIQNIYFSVIVTGSDTSQCELRA